jgi:hypothetical protein
MQELAQRIEAVLVPGTASGQLPIWDNATKTWKPGSPVSPGQELAYAEATALVAVTATTEATAQAVVTAPAVTFDGTTRVIVEFFSRSLNPPAAAVGATLTLCLFDGASSVGVVAGVQTPAAANMLAPAIGRRLLTPTSGAHTYSIRGYVSTGTGNVSAGPGGAGQNMPAYIRVTRA